MNGNKFKPVSDSRWFGRENSKTTIQAAEEDKLIFIGSLERHQPMGIGCLGAINRERFHSSLMI